MKVSSPAGRLKWSREHHGRYKTATEAARAFGWTVSTYLGHENSDRVPSRATAKKYAKAYRVRWEWLLEGEGKPVAGGKTAQAVGEIGAGAQVLPFSDHSPGELENVDIPAGVPEDSVLVIVRGDSMYPRYFEGELLFYERRDGSPREFINRECAVQLMDGRIFVKMLRRGSTDHHFNLESWNPSTPTMIDQAVEWAAPVLARVNRAAK